MAVAGSGNHRRTVLSALVAGGAAVVLGGSAGPVSGGMRLPAPPVVGGVLPSPPATGSGPPSDPRPPGFGVQFHGTWDWYWDDERPTAAFGAQLDALRAAGADLIRVDVGWASSQPTPDPPSAGQYYNQRLGTVIAAARGRGLRVMLTVTESPAWARPGTGPATGQFPADPASMGPWLTWLAGTFGGQVYGWEVWNEPNISDFTGLSDPATRISRYVALLHAAYPALKAGDPHATVVFGGTATLDTGFVEGCYRLGARPYFDVLAVHPYQVPARDPFDPNGYGPYTLTWFPALAAIPARYGDAAKPVWWTETGIAVHSNNGISPNQPWLDGVPDARTAGRDLTREFELVRQRFPQVPLVVVYAAYVPDTDDPVRTGFALLDAAGHPTPQLTALHDYLAAFPRRRIPEGGA